jgi:hypothetical protein
MNTTNMMFALSLLGIFYGLAHMSDMRMYVGGEKRSSGKVCNYLDTSINIEGVYYRQRDLGKGLFECPLVVFVD